MHCNRAVRRQNEPKRALGKTIGECKMPFFLLLTLPGLGQTGNRSTFGGNELVLLCIFRGDLFY